MRPRARAGSGLEPQHDTEVCVIGGGVMGGFAALSLAERNVPVLLIDRGSPGASAANPGTIAIQNKHHGALPLVLESVRFWQDVQNRLGADVAYERRGGFRVAESEADVATLLDDVAAQRAAGVDVEIVYRPQLEDVAGYLGDTVQAASYCPTDGMADSLDTIRCLSRRLRELGVRVWTPCAVRGIAAIADHDLRITTECGNVRSRWVVLAAGCWTNELLAPLGLALPLHTETLVASITAPAPPIFPHVITHVRGRLTLKQQRCSGKVLIGGGWHGDGDHATARQRVNEERLVANLRVATAVVPRLQQLQLIRAWTGFEGRSRDRLLVIGPVATPRGVFVLCTAAGGFTISPFAGELTARWIITGGPDWPVDAYHVQRFDGERVRSAAAEVA